MSDFLKGLKLPGLPNFNKKPGLNESVSNEENTDPPKIENTKPCDTLDIISKKLNSKEKINAVMKNNYCNQIANIDDEKVKKAQQYLTTQLLTTQLKIPLDMDVQNFHISLIHYIENYIQNFVSFHCQHNAISLMAGDLLSMAEDLLSKTEIDDKIKLSEIFSENSELKITIDASKFFINKSISQEKSQPSTSQDDVNLPFSEEESQPSISPDDVNLYIHEEFQDDFQEESNSKYFDHIVDRVIQNKMHELKRKVSTEKIIGEIYKDVKPQMDAFMKEYVEKYFEIQNKELEEQLLLTLLKQIYFKLDTIQKYRSIGHFKSQVEQLRKKIESQKGGGIDPLKECKENYSNNVMGNDVAEKIKTNLNNNLNNVFNTAANKAVAYMKAGLTGLVYEKIHNQISKLKKYPEVTSRKIMNNVIESLKEKKEKDVILNYIEYKTKFGFQMAVKRIVGGNDNFQDKMARVDPKKHESLYHDIIHMLLLKRQSDDNKSINDLIENGLKSYFKKYEDAMTQYILHDDIICAEVVVSSMVFNRETRKLFGETYNDYISHLKNIKIVNGNKKGGKSSHTRKVKRKQRRTRRRLSKGQSRKTKSQKQQYK